MKILVEVDRLENENGFFIMKIDSSEEDRTKKEVAEDIARKNYSDFFGVTLKELNDEQINYFKVDRLGKTKLADKYD